MVIYCSLTSVVLTHCFARQFTDRTFTIQELREEADIKLFRAIVGNPAHLLHQYYLHTDQLNIHYENGFTRSSYQHTLDQHS